MQIVRRLPAVADCHTQARELVRKALVLRAHGLLGWRRIAPGRTGAVVPTPAFQGRPVSTYAPANKRSRA